MEDSKVMVSIIVPVYNHENYIKQALDSIMMQKVNFEYEVLIGEDCSTDNSRAILKNMEADLPSNFRIFYRETNLGMGKNGNTAHMIKRSTGKYLITLEGDDYWIDPNKLQIQVDFLENNPEYIAVAHNTEVVNENGTPILDHKYPECKHEEYTIYDFKDGILAGQMATTLLRREFYFSYPVLSVEVPYPGDRLKNFRMVCLGKVYCIQKKMSAYRYSTTANSWSATNIKTSDIEWMKRNLSVYKAYVNYSFKYIKTFESIYTTECMYYSLLIWTIKEKILPYVTYKLFFKEFISAKYKIRLSLYLIKKYVFNSLIYKAKSVLSNWRKGLNEQKGNN